MTPSTLHNEVNMYIILPADITFFAMLLLSLTSSVTSTFLGLSVKID